MAVPTGEEIVHALAELRETIGKAHEARNVRTLINGRWDLWLPSERSATWAAWTNGWEVERLSAMHELIEPGDFVYDIGAECGDLPCLWASWGADVVMVEPNPASWPSIRATFEANQLRGRLRGWFVGFAGDEERECPEWDREYANPEQDAWPTCAHGPVVNEAGFLVIPERPDCPVITVDTLAKIYGEPTVITIDVEGAELSVLRGAQETLRRHRPAVFVSVHTDLRWVAEKFPGDTGEALDDYMTGLGYSGTHLATDHERHMRYVHPQGR